jgi:DNA polymerase-3 subunit delta
MPAKPFTFICGADDFLVGRLGKERFEALATAAGADDFAREIVGGFANNVEEVETAVNRFRDAVQTVPMFGGQRVVWFKDLNFIADTVTGRAEGAKSQVEALQEILAAVDPANVAVVITAAPVDRRRSFLKWCESHGDYAFVGGDADNPEGLVAVALAEAKANNVSFGDGTIEVLFAKIGANTRLITEEIRKLGNYVGDGGVIEDRHVVELTPNVAEGDFFEAAERFFAGDLRGTLDALQRHFFAGGDARPVISSLQNRNRILIQARVLIDSGDLRAPSEKFGFDKAAWARAQGHYAAAFGGDTEKSSFNLFTQNQWYAGKLVAGGKLPTLRRLIDNQQEFIRAFEEIIQRPNDQETVLREMTVRCLTT